MVTFTYVVSDGLALSNLATVTITVTPVCDYDVTVVPPFRISGCSTAVMLDPQTGSKIAAADPRRDCYAAAS